MFNHRNHHPDLCPANRASIQIESLISLSRRVSDYLTGHRSVRWFHLTTLVECDDHMFMGKSKNESNWGERLRSVLKEKKISLRKAAKIAEVSPSVLDSWTSGSTPKDLHAVKRLADNLGVSFSWLVIGEREQNQSMATVTEIFDETPYFDGYARIRIDRLIPKKGNK